MKDESVVLEKGLCPLAAGEFGHILRVDVINVINGVLIFPGSPQLPGGSTGATGLNQSLLLLTGQTSFKKPFVAGGYGISEATLTSPAVKNFKSITTCR